MALQALAKLGRAVMKAGRAVGRTSSSQCCCGGPSPCGAGTGSCAQCFGGLEPNACVPVNDIAFRRTFDYIEPALPVYTYQYQRPKRWCCELGAIVAFNEYASYRELRTSPACPGILVTEEINTAGGTPTFPGTQFVPSTHYFRDTDCNSPSLINTSGPAAIGGDCGHSNAVGELSCLGRNGWRVQGYEVRDGPYYEKLVISTPTFPASGISCTTYYKRNARYICTSEPGCNRGACCCGGNCYPDTTQQECQDGGGVFKGVGSVCDDQQCAGACCLPDGTCRDINLAACNFLGGSFIPDGHCDTGPCNQSEPLGRCCFFDGSCQSRSQASCVAAGGTWGGPGTTCFPNVCPPPLGACCVNQQCSQTTQAQCFGSWQGPGTTCIPNPCSTGGACCKRDGTCVQVNDPQACVNLQGIFTPGGDCQAITCPQCCYVNEPERTYTLNSGGETIVEGPMTYCCWERSSYAISGLMHYESRKNFPFNGMPAGCLSQTIDRYFEPDGIGGFRMVEIITDYVATTTPSCGDPQSTTTYTPVNRCTSADVLMNMMIGILASGGSGTRHTTCDTATANRFHNTGSFTNTLTASVGVTGGTACSQNCQPSGFRPVFAGDFL